MPIFLPSILPEPLQPDLVVELLDVFLVDFDALVGLVGLGKLILQEVRVVIHRYVIKALRGISLKVIDDALVGLHTHGEVSTLLRSQGIPLGFSGLYQTLGLLLSPVSVSWHAHVGYFLVIYHKSLHLFFTFHYAKLQPLILHQLHGLVIVFH